MRKFFIMSLCLGLSSFMMSAQELTSEVAYKAYMDSLSREFSSTLAEWNRTIPPHFMEAMRLEKEAETHPELNCGCGRGTKNRSVTDGTPPS